MVTFEPRTEGSVEVNLAYIWGKNILGRESCKCEGSELRGTWYVLGKGKSTVSLEWSE